MNQHPGKKSAPPSVGADVSGIETLLNRNLPEVFGEGDPARRRAAIQELYTEDCVLYVPPGTFVGHDALDKFAGDLRATHPHYVYTPHGAPQVLHNSGRLAWGSGQKAKRPSTPVWISSSHGTARSRLFTSTSTRRPSPSLRRKFPFPARRRRPVR
jgi:SnoaL-like domain